LTERISNALLNEPAAAAVNRLQTFLKPLAGFAIAASVAALAIIGVRQMEEGPAITANPAIAVNQPVSARRHAVAVSSMSEPQQLIVRYYKAPLDADTRLSRYLVNYNEYRANSGVQVMMPYVRIVAHDVEE
jgi:hypothetical protein